MVTYLPAENYALHNESGGSVMSPAISSFFLFRRYFDMTGSCLGLVFCSCHLALLTYLVIKKNGKSYELLVSQAIISVLTLILLISGCILDILDDILPDVLLFFRAYIWLFLVNSLMGAYGNLVVVLCLDRYVAMHRPLYYRNSFAKRRMRYSLILGSLIIGFLTCLHWLWVNTINEDGDIVENSSIVDDWEYNVVRTLSYLLKYLCPGVAMSTITWANILFLRKSVRSYDDELRIARQESMDHVVSNHTNISRISIFLAVTFIVCNWPYAVIDYFYDEECEVCLADESKDYCCYGDELEANTAYAIVVLIINFMQIVYIQLNLLFFSLCSSVYRRALMHILKAFFLLNLYSHIFTPLKPVNFFLAILEKIRAFISWKAKSRKIYQEERFLSLSTDSEVSAKTVFTVC